METVPPYQDPYLAICFEVLLSTPQGLKHSAYPLHILEHHLSMTLCFDLYSQSSYFLVSRAVGVILVHKIVHDNHLGNLRTHPQKF